QNVSNGTSFRFLRYLSPSNGYCNVAEVQFLGNVSGLTPPASPVVTTSITNGYMIHVSWDAVVGAESYNVKRSTTPGGPYVIMDNDPRTNFAEGGASEDTTYYYVVSAINRAGESVDSAEVSATTLTAGPTLVARYDMEGDVTDATNYHFDGAAAGSPIYGAGQNGQALVLDGVDDVVTLPNGVASSTDISVAAWVFWNGGGNWQRVFDFGNGTGQYLFLTPSNGTNMRFAIKNGGGEQVLNTSPMAAGQWAHVAVTLGGNTGKLYVNGTPVATNTGITINPSDFSPAVNFIGDSQFTADPLFNGSIDDFRIYNYALSGAEVNELVVGDTTPPASPTGLVATPGDGSVSLDWPENTEPDLAGYTVYRSTTSGSGYAAVATGLVTSGHIDTTAINGTTYYYVVTATGNVVAAESENSAEVSGTPYAPVVGSTLYAHLDGSVGASVTADGSDIVSLWEDQTVNGFDATSTGGVGTVFYPGLNQSESGLDGLDMGFTSGTPKSTLVWFSPAQQDQWLDFNSGAGALPYGGFAVFAVVHPDAILGGVNRDVVMSSTESNFSLRYEDGRPQVRLGATVLQGTAGAVAAGQTVVLGVNYNATTGLLQLWDSESNTTSTTTVAAADFSSAANVFLGGSTNPDQYMQGMLGEAKVFRGAMAPAEFAAEQDDLA
ncbi:MAG: hypothetical protein KDN05_18945, partial [Verrucomicrobiae bacterium]|nr:hypothetical protein [Verrucomicrobiae bacterium]